MNKKVLSIVAVLGLCLVAAFSIAQVADTNNGNDDDDKKKKKTKIEKRIEITDENGEKTVKVTTIENGEKKVETYTGEEAEEFMKEQHHMRMGHGHHGKGHGDFDFDFDVKVECDGDEMKHCMPFFMHFDSEDFNWEGIFEGDSLDSKLSWEVRRLKIV